MTEKMPEPKPENNILVVEDNSINQTVAQKILENLGYDVIIANNGQEAVDYIVQRKFAAILMDIHMPVMDGFTATTEIRQLPNGKTIPIIAMTANARNADSNKCLSLGMNDHITKPISIEKILNTLSRWLESPEKNIQLPSTSITEELVDQFQRQVPAIRLSMGLNNCSNDMVFYINLLEKMTRDYGGASDQVWRFIEQQKMEEARQLVHSVKGVSGNLGAIDLHEVASHFEQTLKQANNSEAIFHAYKSFSEALTQLTLAVTNLSIMHSNTG